MGRLVVFAFFFAAGSMLFGQENDYEVRNSRPRQVTISRYIGQPKDGVLVIQSELYNLRVAEIDNWAFWFKGLTAVTLPKMLNVIGEGAFAENKLASVTIPKGVSSISRRAFRSNEMTDVVLSPGLLSIGEGAFEYNRLGNVSLPISTRSIGDWAFHKNRIDYLELNDGLRSIGRGAFTDNRITELILPDSLRQIGEGAFLDNKLTSVIIGNNVSLAVDSIDPGFFYTCYNDIQGRRAGKYVKNEKTQQWEKIYSRVVSYRR